MREKKEKEAEQKTEDIWAENNTTKEETFDIQIEEVKVDMNIEVKEENDAYDDNDVINEVFNDDNDENKDDIKTDVVKEEDNVKEEDGVKEEDEVKEEDDMKMEDDM